MPHIINLIKAHSNEQASRLGIAHADESELFCCTDVLLLTGAKHIIPVSIQEVWSFLQVLQIYTGAKKQTLFFELSRIFGFDNKNTREEHF